VNPGNRHLAVDEPIINTPFEEPTQYWVYDSATGLPVKAPGRRPAHYYFRSRRRTDAAQTRLFAEEEMVELGEVNKIRDQVRKWREGNCYVTGMYPNGSADYFSARSKLPKPSSGSMKFTSLVNTIFLFHQICRWNLIFHH